jgi:hypothetical protein
MHLIDCLSWHYGLDAGAYVMKVIEDIGRFHLRDVMHHYKKVRKLLMYSHLLKIQVVKNK